MSFFLSYLYAAVEQVGYFAWGTPPPPKYVALVGPAASGAGKSLLHILKTGECDEQGTPVYPERVEDVTLRDTSATMFLAPDNEHEELCSCHGIIYLISSDSECLCSYKEELAALLLRTSPVPVLVLVVCHKDQNQSEEEATVKLGLTNYRGDNVRVAITPLSDFPDSGGMAWLFERLN